jgi:hypothetical protein
VIFIFKAKDMKKIILILSMALVSACGSKGVTNLSLLKEPIPLNESRLIFTRDDSLLYMAASADVSVNGLEIASLARGGGIVYDVKSGDINVTLRTLGSSTKYASSFTVEPRKTYSFDITPRSEAFWPGINYGALFGVFGDAINASVNENAGYFQAVLKEVE